MPDFESCGAVWVNRQQLSKLDPSRDFRGREPLYWFPRVWEGQGGVALDDDRVAQFLDAARKAASSGGDQTAAMEEFEAEAHLLEASHPELFAKIHADDVFR